MKLWQWIIWVFLNVLVKWCKWNLVLAILYFQEQYLMAYYCTCTLNHFPSWLQEPLPFFILELRLQAFSFGNVEDLGMRRKGMLSCVVIVRGTSSGSKLRPPSSLQFQTWLGTSDVKGCCFNLLYHCQNLWKLNSSELLILIAKALEFCSYRIMLQSRNGSIM